MHSSSKYGMNKSKDKKDEAWTRRRLKPFKFKSWKDKSQCRIGIMNVPDILSHGDTPMCQIWYDIVKVKKKSGNESALRSIQTERFLYTPPHLLNFVRGRNIKNLGFLTAK